MALSGVRYCRLEQVVDTVVAPASDEKPSGWQIDVPPRLRWALILVLLFHGSLLIFGTFRGTYDAYVHIFLGDHYARDWFSTWDQRWYTGFTTVSYPPGTHMAMAAVSKLTGNLETAFVIVQLATLALLTVGIYRFSRLWVSREAAANASLLLVCSSAIAQTVHLYGQLPTTFALAFLLNALPFIKRWVFEGRFRDLLVGTVVLAATTAGHHVTTLFGSVFFLGPVLVAGLLAQSRVPRSDEPADVVIPVSRRTFAPLAAKRFRRVLPSIVRGAVLGPCIVGALVIVVLPYWLWSSSDPISQIPIPHGSRANFLADLNLGLIFFFIPWGLMLLVLPYALVRAVVDRMWPLAASIGLLFVLGTGGTTPIPKLLLGPAFDILTLDRFTFWAAIQILPLAGLFVVSVERGAVAEWLRQTGGPLLLRSSQAAMVIVLISTSLFAATLARHRPFQPDPIDTAPIVAFIEKDQHERWRFLTLGFGDQIAWLSAQTTATQVDGNYHSVRRLPELTSTSVERLEGAKYRGISGLGSLQQFLEVPEKYHLKFVFSNDEFYDPLLTVLGWQNLGPLENGIVVWERGDIEPLPAVLPIRELPTWQRLMWGIVPPLAIVSALALLVLVLVSRRFRSTGIPTNDGAVLFGPLAFVDRRLHKVAAKAHDRTIAGLPGVAQREPWGNRLLLRTRAFIARPVKARGRLVRLGAIFALLLLLPLSMVLNRGPEQGPADVVEAYYDDLDFRRWESAYDRLDPQTRPDFELWRLQQSVNGGLLASYAKLDSVEVESLSQTATTATVRADIRYLTAIDWLPVERELSLVRRDAGWFLTPDEPDLTVPPDQLARRAEVDYLIQGRRRVTSLTSELTDIQDRPELVVRSVSLVEREGLPVVVGEVVNADVDPADLTLTAVLRDIDGEVLARYNATDHMMRTLLPRESTPFRIDFEEVAAGTALDFDPFAFSPIELTDDIASVEVYAKAVVTQQGLFRGLQLNAAEVAQRPDGTWAIDGEIRNDGLAEAVVPMVIVSFLDEAGEVAWVEREFLAGSIRPQRSGEFSVEVPALDELGTSDIEVRQFANSVVTQQEQPAPLRPLLELPDGVPGSFSGVRIDLVTQVPAP